MTYNPFDVHGSGNVLSSVEKAQHNTQPFMGAGENETPVVVGDVNNVDNEADYLVEFMYPHGYAVNGEHEVTPEGIHVVRKFTDVKITPRKARRMRHAVSTLLLYFSKVDSKTGEQQVMTIADVAEIYGHLSNEVVEAMETVLQGALGISELDMEYVTDNSLIQNIGEIIVNNSGFFQRDTK